MACSSCSSCSSSGCGSSGCSAVGGCSSVGGCSNINNYCNGCTDPVYYQVVVGDTFYDIATKFGTSVECLIAQNPGVAPLNLLIGTVLLICRGSIYGGGCGCNGCSSCGGCGSCGGCNSGCNSGCSSGCSGIVTY